eukprot:231211-Prymnesium_polylepis.1
MASRPEARGANAARCSALGAVMSFATRLAATLGNVTPSEAKSAPPASGGPASACTSISSMSASK